MSNRHIPGGQVSQVTSTVLDTTDNELFPPAQKVTLDSALFLSRCTNENKFHGQTHHQW